MRKLLPILLLSLATAPGLALAQEKNLPVENFGDDGPKDLSAYASLRFYAKGDGKKHRVRLGRSAVEDYCHFEYVFVAPKVWTRITAPLDEFKQPSWGKQIAPGFKDVTSLGFLALAPGDDEDFELRFTEVEFVAKTPAKGK